MTDTFLGELRADWRQQDASLDDLRTQIQRRQLRTRLALGAQSAGMGVAFLSAGWFVWLALNGAPAIFVLAGIIMLVALPFMALEIIGTARSLRITHSDTPSGLLRRARDQAAAARYLLWGPRISALLLGSSAAGLLLLYLFGQARAEDILLFVPLWGLFALGGWVWQRYRQRALSAEMARCDALLAEFSEADGL